MGVRARYIVCLTATLLSTLAPSLVSAADVTIAGGGPVAMAVPGLDTCSSAAVVSLRTTGSTFEFKGALGGGVGIPGDPATVGRAFCVLQNFHWEQTNAPDPSQVPQQICQSAPATPVTPASHTIVSRRPASMTVSGSTYTITDTSHDCAGNTTISENRLVVGTSTIGYRFRLYSNGTKLHEASGTLTRSPAP